MSEPGCKTCNFRKTYDKNPKSILGRIWRWHINWCPGWKNYMSTVTEAEKTELISRYKLKQKKA